MNSYFDNIASQGSAAFREGLTINPYVMYSAAYNAWERGYNEAETYAMCGHRLASFLPEYALSSAVH